MDFVDLSGDVDEGLETSVRLDSDRPVASTSAQMITTDDDAMPGDTEVEGGNARMFSPWSSGALPGQAILTAPPSTRPPDMDGGALEDEMDLVHATSYAGAGNRPSTTRDETNDDTYSRPVLGADAPPEYNSGADWPSKMSAQQRLRRRSFGGSGSDSDSSKDGKDEDVTAVSTMSTKPTSFRTGLVYSSVMMLHAVPTYADIDDVHPEQPERISCIFEKLKERGCVARMKRIPIREVKMAEVMLVHDKGIWDGVQRTAFFTHESLSAQTIALDRSSLYINEHSARCARLSCGGVIEMCDAVASGRIKNGFAIVRPPGHHAEPNRPMGFCLYNNVSVAARYLQEKYGDLEGPKRCKRILIVDWDVHHGNGTQSAFYRDENVLYISIHRFDNGDFFPSGQDGNHDHVGEGDGEGRNVNVPWPDFGMTDGDYLAAFSRIVMPIATEFAPDIVIVSAGFDAAKGDPLGLCEVSPLGYAHMTYDLASLANGRLVVALEGGYNLDSIALSALSVTETLLGETPAAFGPGLTCSTKAAGTFKLVERSQSPYWKCMTRPYLEAEPDEDEGLPHIVLPALIAQHRAQRIASKYDLAVLPLPSKRGDNSFAGQMLCSPDLLSRPHDSLVVFVHDMGNLRAEELPGVDLYPQQELFKFVDGSSRVLDWAHAQNMSIVDICLHFQLPTAAKAPLSRHQRRPQMCGVPQLQDACKAVLEVWNSYIAMALNLQRAHGKEKTTRIVLIGLGTACLAVTNLVEEVYPTISDCVRAIVQLPAHSTIPTVPKGDPQLRKWYYKHTLVILPYNHALYTFDVQAQAGKRLGQTVRSNERRAIQVLRTEFGQLAAFVALHVPHVASPVVHMTSSSSRNGPTGPENDGTVATQAASSAHGGRSRVPATGGAEESLSGPTAAVILD